MKDGLTVGALMRCTADPMDIWKITRATEKSVWMARCDENGEFGAYDPHVWTFRRTTVLRDFHPA